MAVEAVTTIVLGVAVALEAYSIKEVINGKIERMRIKKRLEELEERHKGKN